MEQQKKQRGGSRPGAGRPANDRNYPLHVRISQEANGLLATIPNKSEYIDNLIRNHGKDQVSQQSQRRT